MLVLSRKRWESLIIGTDVRITVLKVEGNHVRIGIEAPDHVTVLRTELADQGQEIPGRPFSGRAPRETVEV